MSPAPRSLVVRASVVLYRVVMLRYPKRLRRLHGRDMADTFRWLLEDEIRRRGHARGLGSAWGRVLRELVSPLPPSPGEERREGATRRSGRVGQGRGSMSGGARGLAEDLRFAWRSLRREPRFLGLMTLVLGLALALNVVVFALVNVYLLRPLPYPEANRIVQPRPVVPVGWQETGPVFERSASWDLDVFTVVGAGRPEMIRGAWVTPDFLDLYGVSVSLGRTFRPEEGLEGAAPVAIISHGVWQRRFGGSPDVLGRTFRAFTSDWREHSESFTVVGVLPADFWHVNGYTDILAPLRVDRDVYVGRLRSDVPPARAEAILTDMARVRLAEVPADFRVELVPLQRSYAASVRPTLAILQGAVLLVLFIGCANGAVLLLMRSAARRRELGVRCALGAPRYRLIRQLLGEGLVVAGASAAVGLGVASLLLSGLREAMVRRLGRAVPGGVESLSLDGTVVVATVVLARVVGVAFGLVPVLGGLGRGGVELVGRSRDVGGRRSPRIRSGLVVVEVALSLALLAGAGLMVRSAAHLQGRDPGFRPAGLERGQVGLREAAYPGVPDRVAFFESLTGRIRALPQVDAVGLATFVPFSGRPTPRTLEARAEGGAATRRVSGVTTAVDPGYHRAMEIPVLRGRSIADTDRVGTEPVVVVSEFLAATLWPGQDPLGRGVRVVPPSMAARLDPPGRWHTVVGVVGDVDHVPGTEAQGDLYTAHAQDPGLWMNLVVRVRPGGGAAFDEIDGILRELDPDVPLAATDRFEMLVDASRSPTRFLAWVLGGFSAFAGFLAVLGLYGVVAYAARQRRRDLAIRMALGAEATRVVTLFLRQGLVLVLLGLGLGLPAGLFLARALSGQLHGVTPGDPPTHLGVAAILLGTAMLAVWYPARQAASADPMGLLKDE